VIPTRDVAVPVERTRRNAAYHRLPILRRYRVDDTTGCWEWLGYRMHNGYGRCKSARGQIVQAHRAFYEHHVGPIPTGLDLHHRCSNRGCVNPAHLEPVTRAINTQLGAHSKLTRAQADEIRATMDALCAKYGVRPRTLSAIAERTIWKPEVA
jgi:hypothetical protein